MKPLVVLPSRLSFAIILSVIFSVIQNPSTVHAQFMSIPFIPYPFALQSCNNYAENGTYEWRPTHGSPRGINNAIKTELAVKESFPTAKSEGLFIDLQSQPFMFENNKTYSVKIYYECPDPSNITFKVYALKSAPTVNSDQNCSESEPPNISDKHGMYTNTTDYLDISYSGQQNILEFNFASNDSYRYLWLHSDVLVNFGTNSRHVLYVTKIEIQYMGTSGSGSGPNCSQTPENRSAYLKDGSTAHLNWNAITNIPDKYQVRYRTVNGTTWTAKDVFNENNYVSIGNLTPNTPYEWQVRSVCGTSESDWSPIETFHTPGLSDISLTCENLPQTVHIQNLPTDLALLGWSCSDNVEIISSTTTSVTIKAKQSLVGGAAWVRAHVKHPELAGSIIQENFDAGLPYGYSQGKIDLHPWNGPSEGIYYQNWTRIHVTDVWPYYGNTDWEWSAQYSMMQQSTSSNILIKPTTIGYITVKARRNNACGQGPWLTQIFDVTDGDNFENPHGGGW